MTLQRRVYGRLMSMAGGMCVAVLVSASVWFATYWFLPQLTNMGDAVARLVFALKWISVAVLLCFLTGTESVAHERLVLVITAIEIFLVCGTRLQRDPKV